MKLVPFDMERMQSRWENRVRFNLSESSVHPMSVRDLLDPGRCEELLDLPLLYSQSNGTEALRESIAALYPGASIDNIEVTNGGSEANFIVIFSMLEPGDEVVLLQPSYQQVQGLVYSLGMRVREVQLREDQGWAPDLEALAAAVTSKTEMIVLCNPNNPTGAILTEREMEEIVRLAAGAGAWILADEIYQGSERKGRTTPTFWGRYDRVLVTNGLSKAYGLPGLRIGWIAGPQDRIETCWSYHDYTTIAPGTLSDAIARVATSPEGRAHCLGRTRRICRENFALLERWLRARSPLFRWREPEAGAIAYVRHTLRTDSASLADRLLHDHSLLLVPGEHFGMDHFLRIGYGIPAPALEEALEVLDRVVREVERQERG